MHLVYQTVLALLFPFSYILATRNALRPKFNPYCSTKIKCRTICSCDLNTNCSLLPMDETTRNSILHYHNQIRDIQSSGEPQPSSMTLLEYDTELEELSMCWAGRCSNEYSDCFLTPKFQETSQSVVQLILEGGENPSTFLWMQMMSYWLKQATSISVESFNALPEGREYEFVHNFAQLMSDNIFYIGCAWSIMDNLLTFVCTYGPRGPNPHEKIYRMGKYCSFCPEKYECDYRKPFKRLCKRKTELGLTTHSTTSFPTTQLSSTRSTTYKSQEIIEEPVGESEFSTSTISSTIMSKFSSTNASLSTSILSTEVAQKISEAYIFPQPRTFSFAVSTNSPISSKLEPQNWNEPPDQVSQIEPMQGAPFVSMEYENENTYLTTPSPVQRECSTFLYWRNYYPQQGLVPESSYTTVLPPVERPPPASEYFPYAYPTRNLYEYYDIKTPPVPSPISVGEMPVPAAIPQEYPGTVRMEILRQPPPITEYSVLTPADLPPPMLPSHPELTRKTELTTPTQLTSQTELTSQPEITEITTSPGLQDAEPGFGHKKSGNDSDDGSKESEGGSVVPLVVYLCIGVIFIIVGTGFFMLVMYTLRMNTIGA